MAKATQHKHQDRSYLLFPLFALFILICSIFLAISQVQNRQSARSSAQTALQNCDVPSLALDVTTQETELLSLLNAYRQQNGRAPLTMSSDLVRASSWMSADSASHNSLNHTDSLGRDIPTRISNCGYRYSLVAENLYQGSTSPQSAINWWKNSPPHNANMLDAAFTQAGVSLSGSFWTLDLGSPTNTQVSPTPLTSLSPPPSVTPIPSGTPGVGNMQIEVAIRYAGIGASGNKAPRREAREVLVSVYDLDNNLAATGRGFLKYDGRNVFKGTVNLGNLPDGTYSIKVKGTDLTLYSLIVPEFRELKSSQLNVLPNVLLVQGDLDDNNVLDSTDNTIFIALVESCPTLDCTVVLGLIDLNDDGKFDIRDYNLFIANFKEYQGD